ncbi:MAG: hypothetical protein ABEI99_08970 [Halobaculum sp.]
MIGHTITLVDITDQRVRQQRLQVLDRTLRHNIRNRLDVINAHAEQLDGEHASAIRRNTEALAELSSEARRIDSALDAAEPTEVSLPGFVDRIAADVSTSDTEVDVTAPEATVRISREPCRYALRRVIEHAVTDAEASRVTVRVTVTQHRLRVTVASNGTVVSDNERAVVESGREEQLSHATSLWLWGTEWIVGQLNGTLSFEADTVVLVFPVG